MHATGGGLGGVGDVVSITSTPDGLGYYLAQADGAVTAYGDAVFRGDVTSIHLTRPIVGIAIDPATGGYWLVGGDGGVFSFHAPFDGSMEGRHLNAGAVGMAATADGGGYWLVAGDGGVFTFGDGRYVGNAMGSTAPSVGIAD